MKGTGAQQRKSRSAEYFDRIASSGEVIPEPALCYGPVLERLSDFSGEPLADVGCGTGEMLYRIREKWGVQAKLWGVDLSEESLKAAQEKCGGSVRFLQGDAEALPLESDSFGLLLCMHSFHHYPRPLKALREMLRVLHPGGRLFLVENDYPFLRRYRMNARFLLRKTPEGDLWFYSKQELTVLLRLAGFIPEKAEHIGEHSQLLTARKGAQP